MIDGSPTCYKKNIIFKYNFLLKCLQKHSLENKCWQFASNRIVNKITNGRNKSLLRYNCRFLHLRHFDLMWGENTMYYNIIHVIKSTHQQLPNRSSIRFQTIFWLNNYDWPSISVFSVMKMNVYFKTNIRIIQCNCREHSSLLSYNRENSQSNI